MIQMKGMFTMAFTLEAIQEAHKKYTGVDFPKLIRKFKLMGMATNTFNLKSGLVVYAGKSGEQIEVQGKAVDVGIGVISSREAAQDVLKRHQAGETDFTTFCREIARAGVYKWISDMDKMTCSYYDLQENVVIVEAIPEV